MLSVPFRQETTSDESSKVYVNR